MHSDLETELTELFIELGNLPERVSESDLDLLYQFVSEMYSIKACNQKSFGYSRMMQFIKLKDNDLRNLIPSKNAVLLHTKRAAYISVCIWREAASNVCLPNPSDWGWFKGEDDKFVPLWQSITISDEATNRLTTVCSCRTQNCKKCKCATEKLNCLPMCGCRQQCISKNVS